MASEILSNLRFLPFVILHQFSECFYDTQMHAVNLREKTCLPVVWCKKIKVYFSPWKKWDYRMIIFETLSLCDWPQITVTVFTEFNIQQQKPLIFVLKHKSNSNTITKRKMERSAWHKWHSHFTPRTNQTDCKAIITYRSWQAKDCVFLVPGKRRW